MPSGRLEQPCRRQSRDREGEEKHDDRSTCAEEGALPRREARLQREGRGYAGSRPKRAFGWNRRELRGPKTNEDPHRHRRHP
jgi:hypothetical protein